MTIRPARPDDFARLRAIERAAGEAFRPLGMDLVADDEPFTDAELVAYQEDGRAWVPSTPPTRPRATCCSTWSTAPATSSRSRSTLTTPAGLGRALIDVAADWSARRGLPALTLTTYAEVPWNGPYYDGWASAPSRPTRSRRAARIRARERAHGLDRWPRVTMQRPLAPAAPA